jgi:hypothetical protein
MSIQAYPLQWPMGWKRCTSRQKGRFNIGGKSAYYHGISISDGIYRVLDELRKMGISRDDVVISTNLVTRLDGFPRSDQRKPEDPGVAVYWQTNTKREARCIAIDIYDDVAQNLGALAATLDAMRAIERHGVQPCKTGPSQD